MKKSVLMILPISMLLIGGCSNKEIIEDEPMNDYVEVEETRDTETLKWDEVLEQKGADLDGPVEDYPWEDINLTEEQFTSYINDMAESSEELEEVKVNFEVLDFDGETIEFNAVADENATFESDYDFKRFVDLFDKNIRFFYLSSEYSDGIKQPRIVFYDDEDKIISDNIEFIANTNPNLE